MTRKTTTIEDKHENNHECNNYNNTGHMVVLKTTTILITIKIERLIKIISIIINRT